MPVGLVVTDTDVYQILENHQWPLPRLQAPLSPDIKGSQFTLIQRQKINNVIQIVSVFLNFLVFNFYSMI